MNIFTNPLISWQIALSAYMTGLVFFVQICQYPLFKWVGEDNFKEYHRRYVNRTALPIALPMILEMILGASWALSGDKIALGNMALLIVIWFVTFAWSVPCHNKLQSGFQEKAWKSLLRSNAIRAILWFVKTLLLLQFNTLL